MDRTKSDRRCGIDNCRSRRYHTADDGYTYCENDHRQDVGLVVGEDDYRQGASQAYAQTTRAQREEQEHVPNFLGGRDAIILYLQCFQLILQKQVAWLIKIKGYPEELQVVVRDLWTLRAQMLHALIEAPDEVRASQIFSTQTDTEESDREYDSSHWFQSKIRQRAPPLVETLALCYLGLVLMRIPICSAQLHEWIMSREFVYLNAPLHLPQSMKSKLPSSLRTRFQVRSTGANLEKLHLVILNLTWAFKGTFGMAFPAINHHLLLFHFNSTLCLPLDVFVFTENLAQLLKYSFDFPSRPSKSVRFRSPEIRLLSTLVVTVKLLYPFDSNKVIRHPTNSGSSAALVIDWKAWNSARSHFQQATTSNHSQLSSSKLSISADTNTWMSTTEHDAMHMSPQDIDAYLSWFNGTWIDLHRDDEGRETGAGSLSGALQHQTASQVDFKKFLFRLFPTDAPEAGTAEANDIAEDSNEDDIDDPAAEQPDPRDSATAALIDRIKTTQRTLSSRQPIAPSLADDRDLEIQRHSGPGGPLYKYKKQRHLEEGPIRPGGRYQHYRTLEEVPEAGRAFYEDAARLVGVAARDLVRAVFAVEMDMSRWVERQKKEQVDAWDTGGGDRGGKQDADGDFSMDMSPDVDEGESFRP